MAVLALMPQSQHYWGLREQGGFWVRALLLPYLVDIRACGSGSEKHSTDLGARTGFAGLLTAVWPQVSGSLLPLPHRGVVRVSRECMLTGTGKSKALNKWKQICF